MTVLDACDLAACDDTTRLPQWEIAAAIGCAQIQVSRIIKTSLERLSAHASMACGGWSTSDTTEGVTA